MPKRYKSDSDDKEYFKGIIRKQSKRISILEREVSRLTKYLMKANFDYDMADDDEVPFIKAPIKKDAWKCDKCGHDDKSEFEVKQNNTIRRYLTCKGCGSRSRIIVNEYLDSSGK